MADFNVNRVLLSGSLACDPDVRELAGGDTVCFLRLECVTEQRLAGGEDYRSNCFDVIVLGSRARSVTPLLSRGCGVFVQGRLESACWESKDSRHEHEAVSVFAERIRVCHLQQGISLRPSAAVVEEHVR
jgi:single-stranded DNA-binding protein